MKNIEQTDSRYELRSIPVNDAGTPSRNAIDAKVRRSVRVDFSGLAPSIHVPSRKEIALLRRHGLIIRCTDRDCGIFGADNHPRSGLCDIVVSPEKFMDHSYWMSGLAADARLFSRVGRALEIEADQWAYAAFVRAEEMLAFGSAQAENGSIYVAFVVFGDTLVAISRHPVGRFPTRWVIDEVRPVNRESAFEMSMHGPSAYNFRISHRSKGDAASINLVAA
jgi:hypothetical protein